MAVLVKMATALVLACSAPYRHPSQAFPIPRNPDFTCSSLHWVFSPMKDQLREAMIWKSSGQCIVGALSHRYSGW